MRYTMLVKGSEREGHPIDTHERQKLLEHVLWKIILKNLSPERTSYFLEVTSTVYVRDNFSLTLRHRDSFSHSLVR